MSFAARRRAGSQAAVARSAPRWRWIGPVCLALGMACDGPGGRVERPLFLFGIDGADWAVIESMWSEGELPVLRRLAEGGISGPLLTDYGKSPVIWTTIATGHRPPVHGITDFVVPTPIGDVPVSSALRRVPALWNIGSRAGLRTAVLGWWASWPAEAIEGIVVSDRALHDLERRVYPPEQLPAFLADVEASLLEETSFGGNPAAKRQDEVTRYVARRLASEGGYDLMLIYFRGVDIASHNYWKYVDPDAFGVPAAEARRQRHLVTDVYRATDRAIGEILEAAGTAVNALVISDHGFHAMRAEQTRVVLDMDGLLERLGYLERDAGVLDLERSRVVTHASSPAEARKRLRFLPAAAETELLRRELKRDLERVTFEGGAAVFAFRDPSSAEREQGVELVAEVRSDTPSMQLRIAGRPTNGLVQHLWTISGTHGRRTAGIFIAAGPDFDPRASSRGISIHAVAPTVLYGLGLPVAEDFAGRPWTELFNRSFRNRTPLRSVATWGTMEHWEMVTSPVDGQLADELRALGYL